MVTGMVKCCLTPDGATPTIYHARPVLIQGAWIGAKHSKGQEETARGKSSRLLSPLAQFAAHLPFRATLP